MKLNDKDATDKEKQRRSIAQEVEVYLANGGKVNVIPLKPISATKPVAQQWQSDILH